MLVKVNSRKGHWLDEVTFVPNGGTFDLKGGVPVDLRDRLVVVGEEPAATSVGEETPAPAGALTWGLLPEAITDKLKVAGIDTPEKALAATDDALLAIDGIGAATVKANREQVK